MGVFSPVSTGIFDFGTKKSSARSQDGIKQPTKLIVHHMAGTTGALACARSHLNGNRDASATYYIKDDEIIGAVSEDRRPWTSGGVSVGGKSGRWADFRGITVEVSNSVKGDPKSGKGWKISDKSYKSLVRLFADVCKRYGITPHYDGTQNGTLCMHKQFAATACPGEHLEKLITSGQLERDILAEMGVSKPTPTPAPAQQGVVYRVQIGAFKNQAAAESYLIGFSSRGYTGIVRKEGQYFKVLHPAPGFTSKSDAEKARGALEKQGYSGCFVTVSAP